MLNSLAFGLDQPLKNNLMPILDLAVGQPLLSQFPKHMYDNFYSNKKINRYYPASGDEKLKSLILSKYYPKLNTDHISITNGAIGALDFIFRIRREENSSVLIPNPGFPPYEKLAEYSQHQIKKYHIDLKSNQALIDWNNLMPLIDHDTRLLLINSPHNPTGKILHKIDYQNLLSIIEKYPKLYLVFDEVYRDLIYTQHPHYDFSHILNRSYIVGSFSKVFPLQGARIGWVITSRENQEELAPLMYNVNGAVSSYGQELAKSFLKKDISFFNVYNQSRKMVLKELDQYGIKYLNPEGAFYIFIKVDCNEQDFQKYLLKKGIKVLNGQNFGSLGKGYIRISFAQDFNVIKDAIKIMAHYLREQNENC